MDSLVIIPNSLLMIHYIFYFWRNNCINERIASKEARATVIIIRNFCALRLLLKASPPPPKTGDKPVPGACNKTAVTNKTAIIIWKIVITIRPIIYVLPLEMQAFEDHDTEETFYSLNHFL